MAAVPLVVIFINPTKAKYNAALITAAVIAVLVIIARILTASFGIVLAAIAFPLYLLDFYLIRSYTAKYISTKAIVYGAICAALSFILSYIKLWSMPQGGTVTPASMLPLIIYSYSFGVVPGFVAGTVYGMLQLIQDPYILHPMQVIMDYPLPFALLGLAGIIKTKNLQAGLIAGAFIGCTGRFISHVLSGVIFFAEYAGDQNPWLYSIAYNSFVYVEFAIITVILLIPGVTKNIKRLMN
ncbi:MAG TPA: energy-coupled thiamine transporter ThiT [Clostridia bacterium]|nr:energy-coupled thiamine transporter ThiT [Clostridia bacterium]